MHEPEGIGPRDFKIAYKLHEPRKKINYFGGSNSSNDEISFDLKSVLDDSNLKEEEYQQEGKPEI